jgi:hypothetical protein
LNEVSHSFSLSPKFPTTQTNPKQENDGASGRNGRRAAHSAARPKQSRKPERGPPSVVQPRIRLPLTAWIHRIDGGFNKPHTNTSDSPCSMEHTAPDRTLYVYGTTARPYTIPSSPYYAPSTAYAGVLLRGRMQLSVYCTHTTSS